jgi:Ser/Thr protein kinase RdoA (MazF antagonist)
MIPMVQAHGDLSRGNILSGDNGSPYLIDLDRSFEATAYFDVMYYAQVERLGSRKTVHFLRQATAASAARSEPFESDPLRWAKAMFIMDLSRFLVARFEAIAHREDRLCQYTLWLLKRAVGR